MNRRGFLKFLIAAPVSRALPWMGIASVIKPIMPGLSYDIGYTYSELIRVTLRKHRTDIVANLSARNVIWNYLTKSERRQ